MKGTSPLYAASLLTVATLAAVMFTIRPMVLLGAIAIVTLAAGLLETRNVARRAHLIRGLSR